MALPGYELLFSDIKDQLRSKEDALVSVVHWNFIYSGFRLTAVGENPTGSRHDTERLLPAWNSEEIYVLHYRTDQGDAPGNYLLKIIPIDNSLLLHLQREGVENVHNFELFIPDYTTGDLTSVAEAFHSLDVLNSLLSSAFLGPIMGNSQPSTNQSHGSSKKKKGHRSQDSDEEEPHRAGHGHRSHPKSYGGPHHSGGLGPLNPFSVGRADLDPLAGGGGGMLMDPRHSGGPRFGGEAGGMFGGPARGGGIHPGVLPPGAVPPGARFDPFGPPGTRPGPDPDHERPPPGSDDMFM